MTVILSGKDMLSEEDLHFELKSKLHLPDYYGCNLDALWDCLTGHVELPINILWNDFSHSQTNLGLYAQRTLDVFKEAERALNGFSITIN